MADQLKISVCIPTWEQGGFGQKYLQELLSSILMQTTERLEVVISDHSKDDKILELLPSFESYLDLNYIKFSEKFGNSPANTNNAIKYAKNDIIKIMFQDDFFYDKRALELILTEFESDDCKWLVTGSNHTNDDGKTITNSMTPYWNDSILFGVNTISSPSVLAFRKNLNCVFDEELTMLMDCDLYYQLYCDYGLPIILNKALVTNRLHPNQISSWYDKDISDEIKYIKHKYNLK